MSEDFQTTAAAKGEMNSETSSGRLCTNCVAPAMAESKFCKRCASDVRNVSSPPEENPSNLDSYLVDVEAASGSNSLEYATALEHVAHRLVEAHIRSNDAARMLTRADSDPVED